MDRSCPQTSWDWPRPRGLAVPELAPGAPRGFGARLAMVPIARLRTRHSRGSVGLRGEQGTFCPWQACSAVPAGFSVGPGDTHHPEASLPAGGIGLSPKEWAQMSPSHRTGLGSLSQSSPSQSQSGWEPLRISLPFGREMEAAFRSHLFQGRPPEPWPGTRGCGGVPGSLTFPPLTCGSSCFAGAAGCVATLLHDAAMNPAEGNDGPACWGGEKQGLPEPLGSPL